MCPSAVAMRAQMVKDAAVARHVQMVEDARAEAEQVSPQGRSCYVLGSGRSEEEMRKDAEGAERRRLREETPVAGGSG
eukprot:8255296-Heterocapsa_arctica.AAC.1